MPDLVFRLKNGGIVERNFRDLIDSKQLDPVNKVYGPRYVALAKNVKETDKVFADGDWHTVEEVNVWA